jgi:hypothetical protein
MLSILAGLPKVDKATSQIRQPPRAIVTLHFYPRPQLAPPANVIFAIGQISNPISI